MNSIHGSSSRTSSTPASTTLRPRTARLISGLDEGDEVDFDPATAPNVRITSSVPSLVEPRTASPIPSKRLPRSPSAQGRRVADTTAGAPQQNGREAAPTFAGLFGNSWTALQGIASDFLGSDATATLQRQPARRRKDSKSSPRRTASSAPPRAWGPSTAVPGPPSSIIGVGSREQRDALVRVQKRKDLMAGGATEYTDSLGRFKRRTSEDRISVSAPPGDTEDREALVYVHHVGPTDTLAGITIRYNCQAAVLRKSNRMWPNDSVQSKKVLVLPVDACAVKGRRVSVTEEPDLLLGINEESPTETSFPASRVATSNGALLIPNSGRKESMSSDGPPSSRHSVTDASLPWIHDSWVLLPSSEQPTQIARLSRRELGYFPPARRKSQSYSDLDTPSTSLDIVRTPLGEFPQDAPQRPMRPRRLSGAANGYFPSYLAGPGGVGTLGKNVKSPGPAQDGLNKYFASRLPNVAPPAHQQKLYLPDIPLYSDDPSGPSTPVASGTQSPGNINLDNVGGAIEGWVRRMATKATTGLEPSDRRDPARASVGVSGRGVGSIGDLIEMAESFEIGEDGEEEEAEEQRGRPGSSTGASLGSGTAVVSSASFGNQRLRDRGRSGTSAGPAGKGAKDD